MNINLLPKKNNKELLLAQLRKSLGQIRSKFAFKQNRYKLASILDVALILLILINGIKPAQRLFEPLISPLGKITSNSELKLTKEVFSFAPGLAQNKFDNIDFHGLNTLAFFDVPVSPDGQMYTNTRGYASFKSNAAQDLFQRAHNANTKVLLTLTQTDNSDIKDLMNSDSAQQTLVDQSITEVLDSGIDGVSIDFEFQGNWDKNSSTKFSKFISNLTSQMHSKVPGSQVSVTIPSADFKNTHGLDLSSLSSSSDKLFVIASDTAAIEQKDNKVINPVFGYQASEYFSDISTRVASFLRRVPENKLVFERAWYGNGDQYPLYLPSAKADASVQVENDSEITPSIVNKLVAGVPDRAQAAAKKNLPYIINALKNEKILNPNVLSYAMATIEHETDGTFQPIEEIGGRESARRLGYEGGEDYFGRGFIQLTHLRNYLIMGQRIGMGDALAKNPDLASQPDVAAKILAAFFKDNNVANLASEGDFIDARAPINPDYNGYKVAMLAEKYEGSF